MIKENCRETNYNAAEAGVKQKIEWNSESLIITTTGFNDAYECYFQDIFEKMNTKQVSRSFFESKKKQLLMTTANILNGEPMNRYKQLLQDI